VDARASTGVFTHPRPVADNDERLLPGDLIYFACFAAVSRRVIAKPWIPIRGSRASVSLGEAVARSRPR
jgi:hypothetical protein